MMKLILWLVLSVSSSFADDRPAIPSFDCKDAKSDAEKTICSTVAIADLDFVMAKVYKNALGKAEEKTVVAHAQKEWIQTRNACEENLPVDAIDCMVNEYAKRIKELGGTDDLINLYKSHCTAADTDDCYDLTRLQLELKRWPELDKDLKSLCATDDSDNALRCMMYSEALEAQGKKKAAADQAKKICAASKKNEEVYAEACASAYRLSGKKSKNPWVGLYKSEAGILFVEESKGGKLNLYIRSSFANGHSCDWNGKGSLKNNKLQISKDEENPDCKLRIDKAGNVLSVNDDDHACTDLYCGARGNLVEDFTRDAKADP